MAAAVTDDDDDDDDARSVATGHVTINWPLDSLQRYFIDDRFSWIYSLISSLFRVFFL